jgi:hypothetical protein
MKSFRDLYKNLTGNFNAAETVTTYSHKARVQGRWARIQARKQVAEVEGLLQKPQDQLKKMSENFQHDVHALKKIYETQRREIQRLGKNLKKNGDRFLEKSKILSAWVRKDKTTTTAGATTGRRPDAA